MHASKDSSLRSRAEVGRLVVRIVALLGFYACSQVVLLLFYVQNLASDPPPTQAPHYTMLCNYVKFFRRQKLEIVQGVYLHDHKQVAAMRTVILVI